MRCGLCRARRASGGGEAFVADFLHGYGALDAEELNDFISAHLIYMAVWQAFEVQRRPQIPNSAASLGQ